MTSADLAPRRADPAYVAFDLLWFDGIDLRPLPLDERRRRLAEHSAEGIADRFRGAIGRGEGARTLRADAHERPRRYRSEASRGSLRHTRPVAEDQEPGLFAEGRPGRAVQPGEGVGTRVCAETSRSPDERSRRGGPDSGNSAALP